MLANGTKLKALINYESWGGVFRISPGDTIIVLGLTAGGDAYILKNIRSGISTNWSSNAIKDYFEVIKKNLEPPKDDIEWMDRVQSNFKE